MHDEKLQIKAAGESDIDLILEMIYELAEFENLQESVSVTREGLHEAFFSNPPSAHGLLLTWEGKPAGYAVYFYNFSTFEGSRGLYIEDLYIRPALRRRGIGSAVLGWFKTFARERGCARVEWMTLKWNSTAQACFRKTGADSHEEWMLFRIDGEKLT